MSCWPKKDQPKIARRNARIVQAVPDGSTAAQVGARFRLNRNTVTVLCRQARLRFGADGTPVRLARSRRLQRDIAEAVAGRLPVKEAAARFGKDLSSIYRICRDQDVRFGRKGQAGVIAKKSERDFKIFLAAAGGASVARLMRRFSLSETTIRKVCRDYGVSLRITAPHRDP